MPEFSEVICMAIATARAEGYRAGLERAAQAVESGVLRAAAIRALAPVPDTTANLAKATDPRGSEGSGGEDATEAGELRRLLWLRHGCGLAALYGDDGELQCGLCRIDFKRDPVNQIEETFRRMGILATLAAPATGATLPPTEPPR